MYQRIKKVPDLDENGYPLPTCKLPPQCPSCGGFKDKGHKCPKDIENEPSS